jgi:hypothetical protein
VYIASIFILKNPDTLLPHLYSCPAIRYTTIPYQKSAQPPWFSTKVILVMLPPRHLSSPSISLSYSSSVPFLLLFVFSFVSRTDWGSPVLGISLAYRLISDQNNIFCIISRTYIELMYKIAVSSSLLSSIAL